MLLAAGLDSRAYRLPWPVGTRLFELDLPDVLTLEGSRTARCWCRSRARRGARRPAGGLGLHGARRWPGPSEPIAWLCEGLLIYLAAEEADRLLTTSPPCPRRPDRPRTPLRAPPHAGGSCARDAGDGPLHLPVEGRPRDRRDRLADPLRVVGDNPRPGSARRFLRPNRLGLRSRRLPHRNPTRSYVAGSAGRTTVCRSWALSRPRIPPWTARQLRRLRALEAAALSAARVARRSWPRSTPASVRIRAARPSPSRISPSRMCSAPM